MKKKKDIKCKVCGCNKIMIRYWNKKGLEFVGYKGLGRCIKCKEDYDVKIVFD